MTQVAGAREVEQASAAVRKELKASFRGDLIGPGDDGYETARRVWNGMVDKRPALIVRCAGAADVIAAVDAARRAEISVAVRGGGHNVAGNAVSDGGIVIDLSGMKAIRVDARRRVAHAEAGLLWGELDRETQAFGLAVPGGIQSTTGIAGFTLGGGIGWLSRRFGLTCDNLLAADVVTADGRLLTASEEANDDLFFAIRGGGGNFGVVTSFDYRLHPVEFVFGGMVFHRLERAAEVLAFFRDYTLSAPDELGAIAFLMTAPDAPDIPRRLRGQPVAAIGVCYTGPLDEAEEVVRAVREFGPPEADRIRPLSYLELQQLTDAANPPGQQNYWKAEYLAGLSDRAIETIVRHVAAKPSVPSKVLLPRLGGAVGRIAAEATAFGHRDPPFIVNIMAASPDPAVRDRLIGWAREFWDDLQPFSAGGVYVNFLGEEGEDRVRAAYGDETFDRLARLKAKYDPANFFHLNQNIKPADDGSPEAGDR